MFIGLMNSIDRLYLRHCKKKLEHAKSDLAQARDDRTQLLKAKKSLLQSKAAHVDDEVARYKDGWVNLQQANMKLDQLSSPGGGLSQFEYEKYGTECAVIERRIAHREGRLPQHASTSLIV